MEADQTTGQKKAVQEALVGADDDDESDD